MALVGSAPVRKGGREGGVWLTWAVRKGEGGVAHVAGAGEEGERGMAHEHEEGGGVWLMCLVRKGEGHGSCTC